MGFLLSRVGCYFGIRFGFRGCGGSGGGDDVSGGGGGGGFSGGGGRNTRVCRQKDVPVELSVHYRQVGSKDQEGGEAKRLEQYNKQGIASLLNEVLQIHSA